MKKLIRSGLLTSLAVAVYARTPESGRLMIEVHVYNYAGVSTEALARAEQETARIYQGLGIAMEWRNCTLSQIDMERNTNCDVPDAPTRFTVRLLPNAMAERFRAGRDTFGFALLPVDGGFGVLANVFAERAQEMGAGTESQGITLGDLMAHELSHLLLGTSQHSVAGLMRARWQARELQGILRPAMFFFPEQANTIRAQILARMGSGDPAHED